MSNKRLRKAKIWFFSSTLLLIFLLFFISGCAPAKPRAIEIKAVSPGEYDPEVWGKTYPLEYQSWLETKNPRPSGLSKYKKGWDEDKVIYDKLSEFPFMALLYKGWGFGIEYNEPRGHFYMLKDQLEIDPSRVKAGGVCLTCKSPYAGKLEKELGKEYYSMPYLEAVKKIPQKHQELGVACIDCHDSSTMKLKAARWTVEKAVKDLGKTRFSRQEMRSLVCAQCHVTYVIPKSPEMKSTGVFFPWQKSKWGDISIENIIKTIKSDPTYLEWKQEVTGFKLGYIRHPEFEFFSRGSVHWKAGLSCSDCHMPYKIVEGAKISDHNIMSPLKNGLVACKFCHIESTDKLKEQVLIIQDRTMSLFLRAGYQTAAVAKLFQLVHTEQAKGKNFDQSLYDQAKEYYEQAFYRVVYIGAENSVGFHNPTEAGRILGDAIAFAGKAEGLLRQLLTKGGVEVPAEIQLELKKYLNNRGEKKLNFRPEQEFKDPFNLQEEFGLKK